MYNFLYFIHIPWGWAKQRPQFIAEELAKKYKLEVFYKQPLTFFNQTNEITSIKKYKLYLLPFQAKFKIIRFLNILLSKLILYKNFKNYTHIWLTSPELFPYIPKLEKEQILIYDCMDDMLSFPDIINNNNLYCYYFENERKLIEKSDYIFCSSQYLKTVIRKRYKINKDILVVNNALSNNFFKPKQIKKQATKYFTSEFVNIVYLGTISYWMDWDLVLNSLEKNKTICYHFFGPREVDLIKHKRVLYHGILTHDEVNNVLLQSDILVMPFIINDLILSVNPVKLYEYIFANKPVISVSYGESEYFEEYVYLYKNHIEYNNFILRYLNKELPPKSDHNKAIEFCLKNTWEQRAITIDNKLS